MRATFDHINIHEIDAEISIEKQTFETAEKITTATDDTKSDMYNRNAASWHSESKFEALLVKKQHSSWHWYAVLFKKLLTFAFGTCSQPISAYT